MDEYANDTEFDDADFDGNKETYGGRECWLNRDEPIEDNDYELMRYNYIFDKIWKE